MKTRAAVAFAANQPLEIVELDLEGPKAGEVLVEIMATGVCHTDAYTLDGLGRARIGRGGKVYFEQALHARRGGIPQLPPNPTSPNTSHTTAAARG